MCTTANIESEYWPAFDLKESGSCELAPTSKLGLKAEI